MERKKESLISFIVWLLIGIVKVSIKPPKEEHRTFGNSYDPK